MIFVVEWIWREWPAKWGGPPSIVATPGLHSHSWALRSTYVSVWSMFNTLSSDAVLASSLLRVCLVRLAFSLMRLRDEKLLN